MFSFCRLNRMNKFDGMGVRCYASDVICHLLPFLPSEILPPLP